MKKYHFAPKAAVIIITASSLLVQACQKSEWVDTSTAETESSVEFAALLKQFGNDEVSLDMIEYVTDQDTQRKQELIQELGLTEGVDLIDGNFLNGYYIYNPDTKETIYPLSDQAVYHFIDWGRDFVSSDLPEDLEITTKSKEEFAAYLDTYENSRPLMPFFFEVQNGEIIRITERPMA